MLYICGIEQFLIQPTMKILSKCRRADVTFHRTGRIDVSAFAAQRIGIRQGDAINVASVKGKHYLYIACKAENMRGCFRSVCRHTKGKTLRAYNAALACAMLAEGEHDAAYASASVIFVKEYGRMLMINKMA